MTGMLQFCIWKSAMKTCELRAIKKEKKKKKNCTDSGTPKRLWLRALSCSQTYDAERCHRLPLNMHADSNELNTHFDPNALNMHHQWLNGARHAHRLNGAKHVQFSSVPWPTGSSGEQKGRFSRDPLPVCYVEGGPCERFWQKQVCSLFDVVHLPFPLPTTASPTLQGALKDDFREAVVSCDVPEPCKFGSLWLARRGSCGPTRKLILLRTQSLVLCFK